MRTSLALMALLGCAAVPPPGSITPAGQPCSDRRCLTRHEGEVIELAGTFIGPDPARMSGYRVVLADGAKVNLARGAFGELLRPDNGGKRVVVRGRIFTGPIPACYEISSRNGTPWLLETSAMAFELARPRCCHTP